MRGECLLSVKSNSHSYAKESKTRANAGRKRRKRTSKFFPHRPIKGLSIRAGIHLFKSSPIRNSLGVELPIVAGKDVRAVLFSCPREEDEVPVAEAIGIERELLQNWKFYWNKAEMVEPSNLGMHRFGDLARANTTAT